MCIISYAPQFLFFLFCSLMPVLFYAGAPLYATKDHAIFLFTLVSINFHVINGGQSPPAYHRFNSEYSYPLAWFPR